MEENAELAVTKHFEESLRRAKEKLLRIDNANKAESQAQKPHHSQAPGAVGVIISPIQIQDTAARNQLTTTTSPRLEIQQITVQLPQARFVSSPAPSKIYTAPSQFTRQVSTNPPPAHSHPHHIPADSDSLSKPLDLAPQSPSIGMKTDPEEAVQIKTPRHLKKVWLDLYATSE